MNNKEKYVNAFIEIFGITEEQTKGLKYQDITTWDSVGHMSLIGALEDAFDIMMDTDDIIDLSSDGSISLRLSQINFLNSRTLSSL